VSINFQIRPCDVEVARHMRFRRYLREMKIPAFERVRDLVIKEMATAVESCCDFSPNPDPESLFDFFGIVYGDMYRDMHGSVVREWHLLHDQIETIEVRVRGLTGKNPDELDAIELDFWEECNTPA
jgi:hypothetical protein